MKGTKLCWKHMVVAPAIAGRSQRRSRLQLRTLLVVAPLPRRMQLSSYRLQLPPLLVIAIVVAGCGIRDMGLQQRGHVVVAKLLAPLLSSARAAAAARNICVVGL